VLVVDASGVAQPLPELSAQLERFLELTFLVVRLDAVQVIECCCPDEVVVLGWPIEAVWVQAEWGERVGK